MGIKDVVSMTTVLVVFLVICNVQRGSAFTNNHLAADRPNTDTLSSVPEEITALDIDMTISNVLDEMREINDELSRQKWLSVKEQDKTRETVPSTLRQNISDSGIKVIKEKNGDLNNETLSNLLMSRVLSNPATLRDIFSNFETERNPLVSASKRSPETVNPGYDVFENKYHDAVQRNHVPYKRNQPPSCTLDAVEMSVKISEDAEVDGRSQKVVCEGRIRVNKCEGLCNSGVSPDINEYVGFKPVGLKLY